ncbi:hypothetical protein SAMN04487783_1014 [Agrococcus baldri]|uniref:Uncharacterized protein n=1 Tax=Agrococcus baldri TaxID=153730 RepID=A0AA94HLN1_9MICO|nr:hypothetical protein [Agrococcus baldri]SFS07831.1 hypothetical protein SAMN04487783_1014 [Agrococcus baldri]
MTLFEQRPSSAPRGLGQGAARAAITIAGTLAAALALTACVGQPQLQLETYPSPAAVVPATPTAAALPLPDADVVELADRMFLTAEGRATFYAAQPRLADAEEIETACADAVEADAAGWFTGGCFVGGQHRAADRIFVFRPGDERLAESMVTVAAHELLHAAYARLSLLERATVDGLVAEVAGRVPAEDPVHEQIERSTDGDASTRANEQFAYLGSQVALESGFPAQLEGVYARLFTDRAALVDTHRRAASVVEDSIAAADAAIASAAAQESQNARDRAQLDADRGGYETALAAYTADVERFNAMPVEERARWQVTLQPAGAEPITMSWEASLTYRYEELERIRGDLEARGSALSAAEAAAADLRADAEQRRADAIALMRAANPNAVISE